MIRKAEEIRRARDLQSSNRKSGIVAVLLVRVGKALSTLGYRLQARSGVQTQVPVRQVDGELGSINLAQSH
jgi:hypothetical protein